MELKKDCEESDLDSSSLHEQSRRAQLVILAIIFSVGGGLQIFVGVGVDFVDKVRRRLWNMYRGKR